MTCTVLEAERTHLAGLLETIQRCVYFLDASDQKPRGPLSAEYLEEHKKDVLESLAAINERFAKLQDTLGAAMRHASITGRGAWRHLSESLSFYEKAGVLESVASWQLCRATRNLAAHDYETDYTEIAEHFNSLHTLIPTLYGNATRFLRYCQTALGISAIHGDFAGEFLGIAENK